jgi:hypothetical protein
MTTSPSKHIASIDFSGDLLEPKCHFFGGAGAGVAALGMTASAFGAAFGAAGAGLVELWLADLVTPIQSHQGTSPDGAGFGAACGAAGAGLVELWLADLVTPIQSHQGASPDGAALGGSDWALATSTQSCGS